MLAHHSARVNTSEMGSRPAGVREIGARADQHGIELGNPPPPPDVPRLMHGKLTMSLQISYAGDADASNRLVGGVRRAVNARCDPHDRLRVKLQIPHRTTV